MVDNPLHDAVLREAGKLLRQSAAKDVAVLGRIYRTAVAKVVGRRIDNQNAIELGRQYEQLLHRSLKISADGKSVEFLAQRNGWRKQTGSYYTPQALVQLLLDAALKPLLAHNPHPTICDPACGCGNFLVAAAQHVPASCLHGIDIDPVAVRLCQAAIPGAKIRRANTLLDESTAQFDLVIGNPPFSNAIEAGVTEDVKDQVRRRHPLLGGTADVAYYFLDRAVAMVKSGGCVAMVLPRAVLAAPAMEKWRASLPGHLRPNFVYAPPNCDLFGGAAVFVCLLVLGPEKICRYSFDDLSPSPGTQGEGEGAFANLKSPISNPQCWKTATITDANWWQALHNTTTFTGGTQLGDVLQVSASMTTGDAYDAVAYLVDDANVIGMRFVTTGLIDPNVCKWGEQGCRYLKRDYRHPVLVDSPQLTPSLRRRVQMAKRPKIIVAGLTKRIECFLDESGTYIGAVATFSIYHPTDDLAALRAACDALLAESTSEHFVAALGGTGLRGQHITMTKRFLQNICLRRMNAD